MESKIVMNEVEIMKQFDKLEPVKKKLAQVIKILVDYVAKNKNYDHYVLFSAYELYVQHIFNEADICIQNTCHVLRLIRDHTTEEHFLSRTDEINNHLLGRHLKTMKTCMEEHNKITDTITIIENTYMHKLTDNFIFYLHTCVSKFITEIRTFIENIQKMVSDNKFPPITFCICSFDKLIKK